jgi:CRISPR system Cascade subunit CasE
LFGPLHLTRLELNYRRAYEVGDCYLLHKRVAGMFDDIPSAPGPRVLWRLTHPWMLVQSPTIPDHSRLPAGYLAVREHALGFGEPRVETKPIGRALTCLRRGQLLRFTVVAAPRYAHSQLSRTRHDRQVAWLMRCGDRSGGFEVVLVDGLADVRMTEGWALGRKPSADGEFHSIRHRTVMYEGRLRVLDPLKLAETVAAGIGAGRAFGLGLISLAPPG